MLLGVVLPDFFRTRGNGQKYNHTFTTTYPAVKSATIPVLPLTMAQIDGAGDEIDRMVITK